MLVKEYMSKNPLTLSPDEDIKVAFNKLIDHNIRQAPVIEDSKLLGIITDRDLRMALVQYETEPALMVKSVMTRDPITVKENAELKDAAKLISKNKFNALPVVSNSGELTGVLTTTDILNGLVKALDDVKED